METAIGIDYGKKKIGIAIGQTITCTANPQAVLYQDNSLWVEFDKIFKLWKPTIIVVGKPELADGTKHPLEEEIEKFIFILKKRYNLESYRFNEGYSSFEARSIVTNKKKQVIDDTAAALILEGWLKENMV